MLDLCVYWNEHSPCDICMSRVHSLNRLKIIQWVNQTVKFNKKKLFKNDLEILFWHFLFYFFIIIKSSLKDSI